MTKQTALTITGAVVIVVAFFGIGRLSARVFSGPTSIERFNEARMRRDQRLTKMVPDGPSTWTAFRADAVNREHGQSAPARFYRGADGSTRLESFSPDRSHSAITIHNYTQRMSFVRNHLGRWSSSPRSEKLPPALRPNGDDRFIFVRDDAFPAPFEVYKLTQPNAMHTSWFARELNYFEIRSENASGDMSLMYDNFVLGDQPAELFLPPVGVDVRALANLDELAGRTIKDIQPKAK